MQENFYRDVLFSLKDHDSVYKKIIDCKYTQSINQCINTNDSSDCPTNEDNVFTFITNIEKSLKKDNNNTNNHFNNCNNCNNIKNNTNNQNNHFNNCNNIKNNELLGIVLLIVDPKYSLIEKTERFSALKKLSANMIERIPFLIKNSTKTIGHEDIIKQNFNLNIEPVCKNPEVVYNYVSSYSSKKLIVFHLDLVTSDYVKYEYIKNFADSEMIYIIKIIRDDIYEYHLYNAEEFSDRVLLNFIFKNAESVNNIDYSNLCKIYKLLSFNNKRCTKKEKTENILAIISNKDE